MALTANKYRELLDRRDGVIYTHCRNCFSQMPEGLSPELWSSLEGVIDTKTGMMIIGCKRCRLPIVDGMVHPELVEHLDKCGCELCQKKGGVH